MAPQILSLSIRRLIMATTNVLFVIKALSGTHCLAASTASARFQDVAGRIVSLQAVPDQKEDAPTIVLFWAQWCEPCVHELRLVARRQTDLAAFNVIAISVDSRADWSKTTTMLDTINWPFSNLFDEDGAWFAENISADGAIPKAILLDSRFNLIRVIDRVDEDFITSVTANPELVVTPSQGFSFNLDSEYAHDEKTSSRAIAWTSGLAYQNEQWNASTSHQVLRQRRGQSAWTRYEDQLGKTWIERQWNSSQYLGGGQFRLGDKDVYELNGQLLSLRSNRATNEYSYLRGGHVSFQIANTAVQAGVGSVNERLYPVMIDPTRDLSLLPPEARAGFASTRLAIPGNGQAIISAARYFEKQSWSRNGMDQNETRYGLTMATSFSNSQLDVTGACYNDEVSRSPQGCADRYRWNGFLKWRNSWDKGFANYADLAANGSANPAKYTVRNSLFSDPFEPLEESGHTRERRVTVGHSTPRFPAVELSLIEGRNADMYGSLRQLAVGRMRGIFDSKVDSIEAIIGHQKDDGGTRSGVIENTGKIKAQLLKSMHVEWLHRDRAVDSNHVGNRQRLAADFDARLQSEWLFSTGVAQIRQSGQLMDESGLGKDRLFNWFVATKWRFIQLKITRGQDPGGTVCSAGACSWQPPLDGTRASLNAGLIL